MSNTNPNTTHPEVAAWLAKYFALPADRQQGVLRFIIRESIGQIDELMPDATEDERQAMYDRMVDAYERALPARTAPTKKARWCDHSGLFFDIRTAIHRNYWQTRQVVYHGAMGMRVDAA